MKRHLHLLLAASFGAMSIGASAADWTATRIGPFNNQGFAVVDINNAGQVLGQYAPDPFTLRGFLYTPGSSGGLVDLGSFGGRGTIPTALNASGQVAGWSETSDGFAHGFIFKDGRMQRLSLAGEMMGNATDINDRGQVLVHSTSADSVGRDAIFHPAGPPTVLSVPTGSGSAGAPLGPQGINISGQVLPKLPSRCGV